MLTTPRLLRKGLFIVLVALATSGLASAQGTASQKAAPANQKAPDTSANLCKEATTPANFNIVGGGVVTIDGRTNAFMLIMGWPFPVKSLKVAGSLQQPLTIKVCGYDKDKKLLLVTKDSIVPSGEPSAGKPIEYFTQAANVVWEFTKAGITFDTDDGVYVVDKEGATISFGKDGVHLDGVTKTASKAATTLPTASTQPSSPLEHFVGKWVDQDHKDQSIVVTPTSIRWDRGFDEGPEIILSANSKTGTDGGVSFSAASSSGAAMLVGGKLVRPTATDEMTLDGDTLTITEGAAAGKDPSSGFGFTTVEAPIKHVFKKAQ